MPINITTKPLPPMENARKMTIFPSAPPITPRAFKNIPTINARKAQRTRKKNASFEMFHSNRCSPLKMNPPATTAIAIPNRQLGIRFQHISATAAKSKTKNIVIRINTLMFLLRLYTVKPHLIMKLFFWKYCRKPT